MNITPEEFVKTYLPEAKKVEAKTGFHYLIPLTQGALESGWGQKAVGNNFFGIKDTDGVNGNEQLITTTEYLSTDKVKFPVILKIVKAGNKFKYTVKDYFRKYPSAELAFTDHVNFFLKNPRYAKAIKVKNTPTLFFDEIAKAGYATAPDYAEQLKQVMKSVIKRLPK
jgi:flagellar protein FlgJ